VLDSQEGVKAMKKAHKRPKLAALAAMEK